MSDKLDLFYGQATVAEARVYARLGYAASPVQLRGTLAGPKCEYARTLEAVIPFRDLGSDPEPLAEAILPDPCFWSPRLPFLYRVQMEWQAEGKTHKVERELGLRALGVSRGSFYLEGKRFVPRAVSVRSTDTLELADWHDEETALCVDEPADRFLDAASRLGVLVMARCVNANIDSLAKRLARLASAACVGLVVLPAEAAVTPDIRRRTSNLLLAAELSAEHSSEPPEWAQAVVYRVTDAAAIARHGRHTSLPWMAWVEDTREGMADPVAGRAACDRLQAELAPFGTPAGLVV